MEKLYSVWAMFEGQDEEYLSSIITDFNKGYGTDPFLPHITLFGNITASEDAMRKAIDEAVNGIEPFTVMYKNVEYSSEWSKTLYIQFLQSRQLTQIYKSLQDSFKDIGEYSFDPHTSLIYKKDMTDDEKIAERQHLYLKKEYKINRLALSTPENTVDKWLDVGSWKIPMEQPLEG